jgi:hypothetical protein
MKKSCLIVLGLLLIAGPAGAATIASTDQGATRREDVLVPPMRVTELFTIRAVERILYPSRFAQTERPVQRDRIAGGTGYIEISRETESRERPVGFGMSIYSDVVPGRQLRDVLENSDILVALK